MIFLKSDDCLVKVNNQVAEARAKGVTGVPFTIIDGKWAVSGSQSASVYVKVRTTQKYSHWHVCSRADSISRIDIQQAITRAITGRNPYRIAITMDHTCTCCSFHWHSSMIMSFIFPSFAFIRPDSCMLGTESTISHPYLT